MRLEKIDNHTFIDVEKILGLRSGGPNHTYIYLEGVKEIEVECDLYKVKKIIENAMKKK